VVHVIDNRNKQSTTENTRSFCNVEFKCILLQNKQNESGRELNMQVQTILNEKGAEVATVQPTATVKELAALLRDRRIGAAVVSVDGATISGIVSERDIVHQLTDFGPKFLSVSIDKIMTKNVLTCAPTDEIETCMELMTDRRIRHLPVANKGKLAGLISLGDVVKAKMQEISAEAASLKQYIAG
jgi:CBS domain-containing protein